MQTIFIECYTISRGVYMENKRRYIKIGVAVLIGIVAISGIAVGGHMYLDNRVKETKKAEEKEEVALERESVLALKNTFADMKSLDIKEHASNKATGSHRLVAIMTGVENTSVRFDYTYWPGRKNITSYLVADESIQKEGVTTTKVHVIYSDGSEEDI